MLFPDANKLNPDYYAYAGAERHEPAPPAWVNGDFQMAAELRVGRPRRQLAAEHAVPGVLQRERDAGPVDQPDEGRGPAHDQDGLLQHAQLQGGAGDGHGLVRLDQLRSRTRSAPTRSTRRSGSPTPRWAASARSRRRPKYIEGNYVYNNREAYIQDNWKVQPQADARLRHALRAPAAAVRQARPGRELPARQVDASAARRCSTSRAAPSTVAPGTACPAASLQAHESADRACCSVRTRRPRSRTLVPGTGSLTNGLFLGGQGIVDTTYTFPALGARAALRRGLRRERQPEAGAARRRRALLRPAVRQLGHQHGRQPADVDAGHGAVHDSCRALGSGGLTTQGAPALEHDPVRPEAAVVVPVERRRPDGAAVGDVGRRRVRRPAQLQHRPDGEHQRGRLRRGASCRRTRITTLAASTMPGATALLDRPAAVVSRVRRDQPPAVRRLEDVPLAPVLVQPPVPERRVVRLQRHDRAVRPGRSSARACSTIAARAGTRSAPTRRRRRPARQPASRQTHIVQARTSCGICRTSRAAETALQGDRATSSTTGSSRASGRRNTARAVHRRLQLPERRRQRRT